MPAREAHLRQTVRDVIRCALQLDLDGGECIMKEAWEEGHNEAEYRIMESELRRIITAIKGMK